jgi:hypothetical protein
MGRETICICQWANQSARCKVLLEPPDLIVRAIGDGRNNFRHRVSIPSLTQLSVHDGQLQFNAGPDRVALNLGSEQAAKWIKAITTPPPNLAKKLGISPASRLQLIGEFQTEELQAAICLSSQTEATDPDLILANIKNESELNYTLDIYATHPGNPPIWIIYPKGPNKPVNETAIRSTLRHEGFVDTKVASVSATLTALRFVKRT